MRLGEGEGGTFPVWNEAQLVLPHFALHFAFFPLCLSVSGPNTLGKGSHIKCRGAEGCELPWQAAWFGWGIKQGFYYKKGKREP